MAQKKSPLGRGLDALIPAEQPRSGGASSISEIPVSQISANTGQPRKEFDKEALQELAESIKEHGLIQPITLRKMGNSLYQIIAGERRFRASQIAGLTTVPAYIRTADDENTLEMALIENIQRQDLNSLEVALACRNLIDNYGLTQEQLSKRIGKSRTSVTNFLRLLNLPSGIQVGIQERKIEMGHARALLSVDDSDLQMDIYRQILEKGLSVRQVEELVRMAAQKKTAKKEKQKPDETLVPLMKNLTSYFNCPVKIKCNERGKGNISIPFKSQKDMERIMMILDKLKS